MCGFVFKNKGVQVMFDVIIDYMLLLVDVLVIKGMCEDEVEGECYVNDDELFVSFVFKIVMDLFVGNLMFFWVYFGVLNFGDIIFNLVKSKCECIGRIL